MIGSLEQRTICSVCSYRSSYWSCSFEKTVLKFLQYAQEKSSVGASFLIKLQALEFIEKKTPTQVFSCEYCQTFNNTYFEEHF